MTVKILSIIESDDLMYFYDVYITIIENSYFLCLVYLCQVQNRHKKICFNHHKMSFFY